MNTRKLAILIIIAVAIAAFVGLDLGRYLSLEFFRSRQQVLQGYAEAQPLLSAGAFFGIYVIVTGLSLPGAAIMTLVAGDRKSTRLNSSHTDISRMPSSA